MNNSEYLQQIEEAEAYIRQRLNSEQERELESSTGIVLGSGLGMLGEKIKEDANGYDKVKVYVGQRLRKENKNIHYGLRFQIN